MKYITSHMIRYTAVPNGLIAFIPEGTECIEATNMPDDSEIKYWAEPWRGMTEGMRSWHRNYGFGLEKHEVIEVDDED